MNISQQSFASGFISAMSMSRAEQLEFLFDTLSEHFSGNALLHIVNFSAHELANAISVDNQELVDQELQRIQNIDRAEYPEVDLLLACHEYVRRLILEPGRLEVVAMTKPF